jgi:putative transposase
VIKAMLKKVGRVKESLGAVEHNVILNGTEALPYTLQKRLEALQCLRSYEGKAEYARKQIEVAEELGISLRSLYRYIKKYRKDGLEGIIRRDRSDQGEEKVSEEWREFITKSYRAGNRGLMSTSASQIANLVESTAIERGEDNYPSRATVYRVLEAEKEKREKKRNSRAIGWQGEKLEIITKEGIELSIEYSNQMWQCDHTLADILVVGKNGESIGRPWLTTVIDTYSRCIMGMYLGLEGSSAAVTCLALRHSIMPKQYSGNYELSNQWLTYGVPDYLYTDAGADFTSTHIDQVAASLGITLCLRRRPSDGGIVERPFGTINSEFLSTLPGYTTSRLKGHRTQVEKEACITLEDLERLLVRYIVDNYNQKPDPRIGNQSRIARWEAGRIVQPALISERELDILLMRQDRRRVYRGGYIKFANLVYRGELLAGYAGESVVIRYNPRDITFLLIYRQRGGQDVFLARAYAQYMDNENLTLTEAKDISKRLRKSSKEITNRSVMKERYDRNRFVENLPQEKPFRSVCPELAEETQSLKDIEDEIEQEFDLKTLPKIRVYDYDQLRQEYGL